MTDARHPWRTFIILANALRIHEEWSFEFNQSMQRIGEIIQLAFGWPLSEISQFRRSWKSEVSPMLKQDRLPINLTGSPQ